MIVYDLVCGAAHRFEAWFGNSHDFDTQKQLGQLACPLCNDTRIEKAAMAPAVSGKSNCASSPAANNEEGLERLLHMQRSFEAQSDYVGNDFAREALAIHRARDTRSVHGEASPDQIRALRDEGVPLMPMPFRPLADSDA